MDLAGSELLEKGDPLSSKSIATLDQVLKMRKEPLKHREALIPYRESKLTKYLMPYLEGDSRVLWLCLVSPSDTHYHQNLKTLEFARGLSVIKQHYKDNHIPLEDSSLYDIKKKIAAMKLRLSQVEALIIKKE